MRRGASNKLESFNFIYTGLFIFILVLISITSFFNMGRPGYNRDVLMTYGIGATVGVGICLVFAVYGVFNFVKKRTDGSDIPLRSGFVSESNQYSLLSNSYIMKLLPHLAWIAVVMMLTYGGGLRIWDAPDVYTQAQEFATADDKPYAYNQVGVARSIWDVGVMPAFTEDTAALGLSAVFVFAIGLWLFLLRKITKNNIFKYGIVWHIIAILVACPVASIGLGFIPGFAQAHSNVGGNDISFLFAAFFFQTINLYVMWATGLLLPIAHLLHNAIYIFGFSVALSVSLLIIPFIPQAKKTSCEHPLVVLYNINDRLWNNKKFEVKNT